MVIAVYAELYSVALLQYCYCNTIALFSILLVENRPICPSR